MDQLQTGGVGSTDHLANSSTVSGEEEVIWIEEEEMDVEKDGGGDVEDASFVLVKKEDLQGSTEAVKEDDADETAEPRKKVLVNLNQQLQRPSITVEVPVQQDFQMVDVPSAKIGAEDEEKDSISRILLPDEISHLSMNESEESDQEEEVPTTVSLLAGAAQKVAVHQTNDRGDGKEEVTVAVAAPRLSDEEKKQQKEEDAAMIVGAEVATTLFPAAAASSAGGQLDEKKVEEANTGGDVEAVIPISTTSFGAQKPTEEVEEIPTTRFPVIFGSNGGSEEAKKPREGEEEEALDQERDGHGQSQEQEKKVENGREEQPDAGMKVVPIEQFIADSEHSAAGDEGKKHEEKEAEMKRKKEESAVQFLVQLPSKAATEDEGRNQQEETKTIIEGEPQVTEDEVESAGGVATASEVVAADPVEEQQAQPPSSSRGVRFVSEEGAASRGSSSQQQQQDNNNKNESDELAKLDEVEQKLRRKSKEALELVDRIFGLQSKEAEKKPSIQRPIPSGDASSRAAKSKSAARDQALAAHQQPFSADNEPSAVASEQEKLKKALAAGVHALGGGAGTSSASAPATADAIPTAQQQQIKIGEGPVLDVQTVSVSPGLLQAPSDCLLLPGQRLLIVDADAGLSLISLESKQLVKQLAPKAGVWRNAECACLGAPDTEDVYILLEYNVNNKEQTTTAKEEEETKEQESAKKEEAADEKKQPEPVEQSQMQQPSEEKEGGEVGVQQAQQQQQSNQPSVASPSAAEKGQAKGILKKSAIVSGGTGGEAELKSGGGSNKGSSEPEWRRFICRFSLSELTMGDRIEAPKWLRERVVWQCRLAFVPATQCLYLAANTPNQGFLFELRCAEGRWTECKGTRLHSQFADLHAFAVVGPVTELLVLETHRQYVQLLSVYNSQCVQARTLGLCERPGALCIDDRGNLLLFDRSTCTVGLFSRAYLEKVGDLALVERAHCQLSARGGLLAVLCRPTRELKLHRYGDRLRAIEQMLDGGEAPTEPMGRPAEPECLL